MNTQDESAALLKEIRDLLKSREEKYDQYLKNAEDLYIKRSKQNAGNSWIGLMWWAFAVFVGVYGALLMAKVQKLF